MVLRPAYPDIDSERQVVIEEIAMYEDEPSDKVHDVLAGAIFGDHPLGRPVIGRAEVISSVPVPEIAAYHDGRYVPDNLVVAAAGNLDHDRIVELVDAARRGRRRRRDGAEPARARAGEARACASTRRRPSSTTSASAGPGIARGDERRFALRVLDTILGGSTSSRLFQEVREKRGLAYSVYSYSTPVRRLAARWRSTSARGPTTWPEAMEVIGGELRRLRPRTA